MNPFIWKVIHFICLCTNVEFIHFVFVHLLQLSCLQPLLSPEKHLLERKAFISSDNEVMVE